MIRGPHRSWAGYGHGGSHRILQMHTQSSSTSGQPLAMAQMQGNRQCNLLPLFISISHKPNPNPRCQRIQHHLHNPCTPSASQTNNQDYRGAHTTSIHQCTDPLQSTQDHPPISQLNQNIGNSVSGIQAYYHRELYLNYLQQQQRSINFSSWKPSSHPVQC